MFRWSAYAYTRTRPSDGRVLRLLVRRSVACFVFGSFLHAKRGKHVIDHAGCILRIPRTTSLF